MDIQVWEKTIIAWLNTLNTSTPITSANQISDCFLRNIIKKIKPDFDGCPVKFLKDVFPNLVESDSFSLLLSIDCLCAATLLLVYVSFSKITEFEEIRDIMCTRLDNSTQMHIAEFLMGIQEHDDIFNISLKTIKEEILKFVGKHSLQTSVDGTKTPIKTNISNNSFDSPLQGFFQTPKRSQPNKHMKSSYNMCGDGDHLKLIKKLTNQLVEEELDKASLQEQLNIHIQKCSEYENKLRKKIEEINQLKFEWENETKKNESEVKSLKTNIMKKFEDEKKLKNELSHLENFVSRLESDYSISLLKNDKLEKQMKAALERCATSESQLKEATELNSQLQNAVDLKEKELSQLREYYVNFYNDEKSIDLSYLDRSFDKNVCPPENMGVVIDKLLRERITENNLLKETVEELSKEKEKVLHQLKSLNEQLTLKSSIVSELQYLNKELNAKVEHFEASEKELFKTQEDLIKANVEIERLAKENSHLLEKCNCLNGGLIKCEEDLKNCKNSKMLLYMNFIKMAEDFKAVQQQLESEVSSISNFTSYEGRKGSVLEKNQTVSEVKDALRQCKYNSTDSFYYNVDMTNPGIKEELTNSSYLSGFTDDKLETVTELVKNFENSTTFSTEWPKVSMQKTFDQLNSNVIVLKARIQELEHKQKIFSQEKADFDKQLKESEEKIRKMQSAHCSEIKKLKEELEAKENKIKELESLIYQSKKVQEDLLKENEILKKGTAKSSHEANTKIAPEGGDYKNLLTVESRNHLTRVERIQEQEPNDSLEEIPVCNKTFDIVNLEEKSHGNRTFSIRREEVETVNKNRSNAWTVSPPSKVPPKVSSKEMIISRGPRPVQGESWVVPLAPSKSKGKSQKLSASVNDVRVKSEVSKAENNCSVTKSSSLSSILEIEYSPPSKSESKSSTGTSFFSATSVSTSKEMKEKISDTEKQSEGTHLSQVHVKPVKSVDFSPVRNFKLVERSEDPLREVFNRDLGEDDSDRKTAFDGKISELQKEISELSKECIRLRSALSEAEQKRKKDKETFEKNQEVIRQNVTTKYESQLEHLKSEMKQLYNRELAKHKSEQSSLNSELREQNKRYKEHIDELRNQLWDLGEKLLEEQKLKRDLERNYKELKKKFESMVFYKDFDSKGLHTNEIYHQKEASADETIRLPTTRQLPNATFPTIPTEDEDEVFDNRFLEDLKTGVCKAERPEGRLMELQYRNSLCLPHLKSSYPGETQFHNPNLFKESDLKLGLIQFGHESQSLTDSDHSMTKSLLPDNRKKKEQTSYKRPGPPTPSKNGGRLSIQSGDVRLTPRNVLKELNDQNERNRGTPNPLKILLSSKNVKNGSLGVKDENAAPVTPRKKLKFFRKPFGARDH